MRNGGNMKNLRFDIKCARCNTSMDFYNQDFNFKDNYDNYYTCPKCKTSCLMQVRYNRPINLDYYSEEYYDGDGEAEFEKHIKPTNIHKYINDKLQGSEFE